MALEAVSTGQPAALSATADTVVRSADYSLAAAQMAIAISGMPASRRNNLWLLALSAPIASAAVREAIRPRFFKETPTSPWAIVAPALVSLAGAGALLMTRYHRGMPRSRGCP